jgi:hypothetical protein
MFLGASSLAQPRDHAAIGISCPAACKACRRQPAMDAAGNANPGKTGVF